MRIVFLLALGVGPFLQALYAEHEAAWRARLEGEWQEAVAHGVPSTPENHTTFLQAMFVYHLVRHGEILGNTFLIREEDGRHPDTMLRDAFAATPRWRLSYDDGWQGSAARTSDGDGDVFSYGRCDEFEMEESALMRRLFGLHARIAMLTSDHVVTEVALDGGWLRLDSSFLRCIAFSRARIADAPPEDGVYSVAHTNYLALRDFHANSPITAAGAKRITAALDDFLRAADRPAVYCRPR